MKQIQISEELFTRLCAYHLMDRRLTRRPGTHGGFLWGLRVSVRQG